MKDIIEELKKNKTAFGLLGPEEQECLKKTGGENCLYYDGDIWVKLVTELFSTGCTYRIKPFYQPKPKFVDLEIVKAFNWLGVWRIGSGIEGLPYDFNHLHCLPSQPNFMGFHDKTGDEIRISIGYVATEISEGKKVHARFRK